MIIICQPLICYKDVCSLVPLDTSCPSVSHTRSSTRQSHFFSFSLHEWCVLDRLQADHRVSSYISCIVFTYFACFRWNNLKQEWLDAYGNHQHLVTNQCLAASQSLNLALQFRHRCQDAATTSICRRHTSFLGFFLHFCDSFLASLTQQPLSTPSFAGGWQCWLAGLAIVSPGALTSFQHLCAICFIFFYINPLSTHF